MLLWSNLKRILKNEGWEKSYGISASGNKVVFYERGTDICEVEKGKILVIYTMHYTKSGEQISYHNYKTGDIWYCPELKRKAEDYFKTHKKYKKLF